jgi:kinesin family protein 11
VIEGVLIYYLLLQEYTAEIERLRRDLAATRDKNGVYLASDNYTQMIMQLEQQEQEMSQMLAHIKALKEEMDKKEASSNTHRSV